MRGVLIDEVVGGAGVGVARGVLTGLEEVVLQVVLLGWLEVPSGCCSLMSWVLGERLLRVVVFDAGLS